MTSTWFGNVMVDVETLDVRASAVVLSVGVVAFDDGGGLGPTLHEHLEVDPQIALGATVSGSTLLWWLGQSSEAREGVVRAERRDPRVVLGLLEGFLEQNLAPDGRFWARSPTFDLAILRDKYQRLLGREAPWKFYQEVDQRTLTELVVVDREEPTVAHSALADALAQAVTTQRCLARLGRARLDYPGE